MRIRVAKWRVFEKKEKPKRRSIEAELEAIGRETGKGLDKYFQHLRHPHRLAAITKWCNEHKLDEITVVMLLQGENSTYRHITGVDHYKKVKAIHQALGLKTTT